MEKMRCRQDFLFKKYATCKASQKMRHRPDFWLNPNDYLVINPIDVSCNYFFTLQGSGSYLFNGLISKLITEFIRGQTFWNFVCFTESGGSKERKRDKPVHRNYVKHTVKERKLDHFKSESKGAANKAPTFAVPVHAPHISFL